MKKLVLIGFRLFRIEQWVKNLFVFIPVFFAAKLVEQELLLKAIFAFFIFSIVASGVYVFNDICDVERDKKHPEKQFRPIASGEIGIKTAYLLSAALIALGLVFAYMLIPLLFFLCLFYVLINIAYSIWLKHFAIIDVAIIALGFLLRIFAGAVATDVKASHWLIVMTFLLALILGFAKRRGEFLIESKVAPTRLALDGYNLPFLDAAMIVSATVAVMAYLMYCFSPEVTTRIASDRIYYTAFFVIMGLFRYLQLTYVYHKTESPTRALLRDGYLKLILIAWVACFLWLLYAKKWAAGTWFGDLMG
jgi:decaprenyl-phosphate phosphoribosyltransferase